MGVSSSTVIDPEVRVNKSRSSPNNNTTLSLGVVLVKDVVDLSNGNDEGIITTVISSQHKFVQEHRIMYTRFRNSTTTTTTTRIKSTRRNMNVGGIGTMATTDDVFLHEFNHRINHLHFLFFLVTLFFLDGNK